MMFWILRRCAVPLAVLALVPVVSGCGQGGASAATTPRPHCPSGLAGGYRGLADRVGAPVYCPAWLPSPLVGKISQSGIGSSGDAIPVVSRNHSYMISWNWAESDTGEVHVILRGYPGRTTIPTCELTTSAGTQKVPCFADANGRVRVGPIDATLYTVNQGADQWHLLYAWRHGGGLYTASQHVAAPLTYERVKADLRRILAHLVLVSPGG
jgi:hypothetical protein